MNANWSTIFALCALLVSTISPVGVAFFNNRHAKKMQAQQFEQNHRIAAIERYVRATGALCDREDAETVSEYGKCLGEAYLYMGKDIWPLLDEIDELMTNGDYQPVLGRLQVLCKRISDTGVVPPAGGGFTKRKRA